VTTSTRLPPSLRRLPPNLRRLWPDRRGRHAAETTEGGEDPEREEPETTQRGEPGITEASLPVGDDEPTLAGDDDPTLVGGDDDPTLVGDDEPTLEVPAVRPRIRLRRLWPTRRGRGAVVAPEGGEGPEREAPEREEPDGAEHEHNEQERTQRGDAAHNGSAAPPEFQGPRQADPPGQPGSIEASPPVGDDEPTLEVPVVHPRVHPRMRERWVAVRRQEGRRRLHVLLIGVAVVCVLGVGIGVLVSPLTGIHQVRTAGNVHESRSEVRRVAGLVAGTPLLSINPGAAEARLKRLPWILTATVHRSWPTTVSVHVTERLPVGIVGTGSPGSLALVDRTGRVLADVAPVNAPLLPALASLGPAGRPGTWLAGTTGSKGAGGRSAAAGSSASPDAVLELAAQVPPSLHPVVRTISGATAAEGGGLAATIAPAGTGKTPASARAAAIPVIFGDTNALPAKLLALQTIVEQVNLTGVTLVDVSVPNRPVLEGG
jgi:hypothetical protein